jgi:hypothetical protein
MARVPRSNTKSVTAVAIVPGRNSLWPHEWERRRNRKVLLFDLGRPDVWPVDDYGVHKGFAKTFRKRKLPTPKQLVKFGEKWRPYRSVAAWYFWRALDALEKLRD